MGDIDYSLRYYHGGPSGIHYTGSIFFDDDWDDVSAAIVHELLHQLHVGHHHDLAAPNNVLIHDHPVEYHLDDEPEFHDDGWTPGDHIHYGAFDHNKPVDFGPADHSH